MTQKEINKILEEHKKWLNDEGGERADLWEADLREADLRKADLRGANLDFSCWPLWCGSFDVKIDKRIFAQLAYHLCRVDVDDEECKAAQRALAGIANQFHRVGACGRIGEDGTNGKTETTSEKGEAQ